MIDEKKYIQRYNMIDEKKYIQRYNMIDEKEKIIKDIKEDYSSIKFYRDNYIFEEEISLSDLKLIQSSLSKLWLIYYHLYQNELNKIDGMTTEEREKYINR